MNIGSHDASEFKLARWQETFVGSYLRELKQRSLLVVATGAGKTVAALFLAEQMRSHALADSLLVLSSDPREWRDLASRRSFDLSDSIEAATELGAVSTIQALHNADRAQSLLRAAKERRWLMIAAEAHRSNRVEIDLITQFLAANNENRLLAISGTGGKDDVFGPDFQFDCEFYFDLSVILTPDRTIHVARAAPSVGLLARLQRRRINIDELTWRQFETLIADLLRKEGYTVEQMRGTKDGGVDVVAVQDLGVSGLFKTIWQAKKKGIKNKVGLSVVRELADTREEHGASKAIIVTSTYLTKGALERIKRDNYVLGKVDRDDLQSWIQRHFTYE